MQIPQHTIFGSHNSTDYDIVVYVDELGPMQDNHDLCRKLDYELSSVYTDKKVNCNLAVLRAGFVVECFKGTPDELNNAIYLTYKNHTQAFSNPITGLQPRNVELKIARCIRGLLTYTSRSIYRVQVKALSRTGTLGEQIAFLESINLDDSSLYDNKGDMADVYKALAFQIGQTYILLRGDEVYTKKDIYMYFPKAYNALNRRSAFEPNVDGMKTKLFQKIYEKYPHVLDKRETDFIL